MVEPRAPLVASLHVRPDMSARAHAVWMIVGASLFVLGMWTQTELDRRRAEVTAKQGIKAVSTPPVYRINCNVREVVEACKAQRRMERISKNEP